MKICLHLVLALLSTSAPALAADANRVPVTHWLTAGPLIVPEPLFLDSAAQQDIERYLETDAKYLDWHPAKDESIDWLPGETAKWETHDGEKISGKVAASAPAVMFAATYITSTRWQKLPFTIRSARPFAIWVDGKFVDKQMTVTDKVYELKPTLTLHRGKHRLLFKAVGAQSMEPKPWSFEAAALLDSSRVNTISFDTNPRRSPAEYADWGLFHELSAPVISPDGKLAAVIHSSRNAEYKKESWLEIFDTKTAARAHTIRPGKSVSQPFFFPKSNRVAFAIANDEGTTIWTYDLATREQSPLIKNIKGLDKIVCAPDERFLYYTTDVEEKDEPAYRHFDELEDKVTDWTSKRRLYVASVASGTVHELTTLGTFAFDRFVLSREGDKLAFVRWVPRPGRPYYDSEIWVYDIAARSADKLVSLPLTEPPANLTWLPGGNQLAYSAASFPSSTADTVFHNVNHHPLYVLDLRTRVISNLSEGETFSVDEAGDHPKIFYNPRDQKLYVLGLTGGQSKIYRRSISGKAEFSEVKLSRVLISNYALSADGSSLVATASSPQLPFAALAVDLKSGQETTLLDPNIEVVKQFDLAPFEEWDCTNSAGDKIEGWLHFPPDFDPSRKWPMIVYYYGGVSPRDERFSFTYHWWAANGYVVYVLNPVGSVGYGQEFADKHSNDWGTLATRDVIECTQQLIAAKSYVDAARLGAYGGSYGGFITLDLVTKTDMFAAAADMYGISNIASYYGGGTWGHLYGDLALPGSFPWANREIFVEKSPLFHANNINTPLLILHGAADENVPPVESDQMFAALKVLGRDVEYVKFKDEPHGISAKFENLIAHREMMLEWFDKYLKGEPEAWQKRWKAEGNK